MTSENSRLTFSQVLIREGPELTHKLLYPIVTYVQELVNGTAEKGAEATIEDELPRLEQALEHLPHTHLLAGLSSREHLSPVAAVAEGKRLV